MALHKKMVTSKKGRTCKYPSCKHKLSIYNHEAYCNIHGEYSSKKIKAVASKSKVGK